MNYDPNKPYRTMEDDFQEKQAMYSLIRMEEQFSKLAVAAQEEAKSAKEQAEAAREQVKAAREQAEAARNQVKIALEQVELAKQTSVQASRQARVSNIVAAVAAGLAALSWIIPGGFLMFDRLITARLSQMMAAHWSKSIMSCMESPPSWLSGEVMRRSHKASRQRSVSSPICISQ